MSSPAPRRLAVVAHPVDAYSPRRLAQAAREQGHEVALVDARRVSASAARTLLLDGWPVEADGAVHILSTDFPNALDVLERCRATLPVLNPRDACLRSADKHATYLALLAAGVPTPATTRCTTDAELLAAAERHGWPAVVKRPDGSGGEQVRLARDPAQLRACAAELRRGGGPLLVQRFVARSSGTDLRLVVVGGAVVAAGRRVALPGEFRSNLAQGGHGERAEPTERECELAVRAAAAVGLDVAGVDVLADDDGPVVLETNSFPGLYDIEPLTGVDVAGAVVALLADRLRAAAGSDDGLGEAREA
ncbi:ribosomal protein S6--L-glutamate ligase [Motilibacter peucedani]|uniref:Ribosomal protein S6--L-glutamate ligase n=1 Tax=Motilibacter peucedani TaxID=598650 RepID=A0A420XSB4_9ACTN|nr:RimK family alpha-L-glutamate ligase [Motilibacter peucedani]RKS77795.1 ribosomal protein S6--L-glutamate ligase [Motilibacter peucedani]